MEQCSRILSELIRVNPFIGAPERSGPYSGNPCPYLPLWMATTATNSQAVFTPCPPRPCHLISVSVPITGAW